MANALSDDEADIEMHRQADWSWMGKVVGEENGIAMIITFRWTVASNRHINGNLKATVSRQGMTCKMNRTYEPEYSG